MGKIDIEEGGRYLWMFRKLLEVVGIEWDRVNLLNVRYF